jgi:hypothetical protein
LSGHGRCGLPAIATARARRLCARTAAARRERLARSSRPSAASLRGTRRRLPATARAGIVGTRPPAVLRFTARDSAESERAAQYRSKSDHRKSLPEVPCESIPPTRLRSAQRLVHDRQAQLRRRSAVPLQGGGPVPWRSKNGRRSAPSCQDRRVLRETTERAGYADARAAQLRRIGSRRPAWKNLVTNPVRPLFFGWKLSTVVTALHAHPPRESGLVRRLCASGEPASGFPDSALFFSAIELACRHTRRCPR